MIAPTTEKKDVKAARRDQLSQKQHQPKHDPNPPLPSVRPLRPPKVIEGGSNFKLNRGGSVVTATADH